MTSHAGKMGMVGKEIGACTYQKWYNLIGLEHVSGHVFLLQKLRAVFEKNKTRIILTSFPSKFALFLTSTPQRNLKDFGANFIRFCNSCGLQYNPFTCIPQIKKFFPRSIDAFCECPISRGELARKHHPFASEKGKYFAS